jgi:hypothetical protein
MPIRKQEFYEGAALHRLIRAGALKSIRYDAPFFVMNDELLVYLKYSTKNRSPWGFTLSRDEQSTLRRQLLHSHVIIGLVCGADGVVAVKYEALLGIASSRASAIHISCYRKHNQHYEVNGPDGTLNWKVAPSDWQRILHNGADNEAP